MKKVYYLSTCQTCKKIIAAYGLDEGFEMQDVKKQIISEEQLDELYQLAGSYEALFNKGSQKYRLMGLKDKNLSETEIKELILQEYTLLKRPTVVIDGEIFIGNGKKNLEALGKKLGAAN
ncbi:ArsC/Spx/MgsR family protein [Flammeovirgaceae bacterium SG7u.111]|nr:ArsC/Spx/MgsR family protein [Flammeovirgaceae bacterium SG7u.132]WPO34263.1 ArsC/Spx/MgsR family protein [Flammeovirgaceae bacterium SG7u.111]